ncbi:hypothetical protein [Motiliproteus sp. SC1-56]|uniref:hypothetical protein n=1 Tax=Motiliproteus sp. SC1-56 TaxID=2799565 RepID=UPI001A8FAF62|nr:hypothetical protein [Motiliproteus sp. SC1-56]
MQCLLEKMVAHWGWCCSAGCRYVSIMHGISSRFVESFRVNSLLARTNPSHLLPLSLESRSSADCRRL